MISEGEHHILVIDDDTRLCDLLNRFLQREGFHVSTANTITEARTFLTRFQLDLLILDVMLPDGDGLSFCKEITESGHALPILLLTAMGESMDRIKGLEAGADDYLAKPFETRELALRVQAILRRTRIPQAKSDNLIQFGEFSFDSDMGTLSRNDEAVHLTSGEVTLLRVLSSRPGAAFTRDTLAGQAGIEGAARAIDTQIARLRRKIEDDPGQPKYLLTLRNQGYVLALRS